MPEYESVRAGTYASDSDSGAELARKINDNFTKTDDELNRKANIDAEGKVAHSQKADNLSTPRDIALAGDVTASAISFSGGSNVTLNTILKSVVASGKYTKVIVNEKGLVVGSETLSPDDIPALSSSKITGLGSAATKNIGQSAGCVVVVGDTGKIDESVLPILNSVDVYEVANETEMLALPSVGKGDFAVRSDGTFILKQPPATDLSNWVKLTSTGGSGSVDVTGKADKVSGATASNFAALTSAGNLQDSGKKAADFSDANHNHDSVYSKISDLNQKIDKISSPNAGNLVVQDASGSITNGGPHVIVPCSCIYDAATSTHALTKQFPGQHVSDLFVTAFVPDHDYTAGDSITFEGEACSLRYDNSTLPVENGAFRAGLCKTLNFHKMDGGGGSSIV